MADTIYYLVTYFFFGSMVIWFFGYKLFPEYLAREGKIDPRLGLFIGINIILLVIGISSHSIMAEVLELTQISDRYAPKSVRIALWVLLVLLGIILMASIRVAGFYHLKTVQKIEHKAERAEAELKLLKSQISPHFLFNTLNNIYGLAYLRDERAAEMISKLSKIMRYLLYDCDQHKVPLSKERDLIEHYLSIQLLKHEDPLNVDFYYAGITNNNIIAPMILINFVENCFKHSDLESNPQGWIKIGLEVENNELNFRTENTIRDEVGEIPIDRKGIGLTNSLKLLEANYPGKHEVEITKEDHVYQLDLKITL
ncbi:MAG: histidine kinase [Cytophagales bacterium]|nr:histidine kinase [Cytophagales bacterium]